jgi:hypothetical protein
MPRGPILCSMDITLGKTDLFFAFLALTLLLWNMCV